MTHYKTIRDLLDAVVACKTQDEADAVLAKAKEDNPQHAEENIGYLLGYLDRDTLYRVARLFATCNHPVFGTDFGRGQEPSPEEAFEMGKRMGEKAATKRGGR